MPRIFATIALMMFLISAARAQVDPQAARELYNRVTPSLVVMQYTVDTEVGRTDLTSMGIVVSEDGMVVVPAAITPPSIPDEQMKDFKIIVPGDEELELDAEFLGRDDRSALSFVKVKQARPWKPLKFEDVAVDIGDRIHSIGLLPKDAGYKTYLMNSTVSATLRGPVPQVLVSGDGVGAVGSPVFNAQGQAIGIVHNQGGGSPLLGAGGGRGRGGGGSSLASALSPPKLFVPSSDFLSSLADPPVAGKPLNLPWLGVAQLSGLQKDLAEYFNLKGQPAIQIADVIPGFAADKGGLKPRDIIVKMNGQPLERGDEPDETPQIMTRKIQRMKPGQTVTFSVLREKDKPLTDITVTLEERPMPPSRARRFFAEDLGFTTREIVFDDTYQLKIAADTKGVIVALIKPNSSAQTGRLQTGDLILKLNQSPVESLDQFKAQYEAFRKDRPRDAVVIEVLRGVNTEVVRIEPPQ